MLMVGNLARAALAVREANEVGTLANERAGNWAARALDSIESSMGTSSDGSAGGVLGRGGGGGAGN